MIRLSLWVRCVGFLGSQGCRIINAEGPQLFCSLYGLGSGHRRSLAEDGVVEAQQAVVAPVAPDRDLGRVNDGLPARGERGWVHDCCFAAFVAVTKFTTEHHNACAVQQLFVEAESEVGFSEPSNLNFDRLLAGFPPASGLGHP